MSRESEFLIYCMERYRYYKNFPERKLRRSSRKAELMSTLSNAMAHFILLVKNT